jgi:hypothetical protein
MSKLAKERLRLDHIGPIIQAEIRFGDLTVFTGHQATGKSISLQFFKLLLDTGYIHQTLIKHGMDWSNDCDDFLDIYFGEGMHRIWKNGKSCIEWRGQKRDIDTLACRKKRRETEELFYIPAQRVLALRDGWPRYFTDFSSTDPFVVRDFSEKLRILIDRELLGGEQLFPQKRRLKEHLRDLLQEAIYLQFQLGIDKARSQKRLVLTTGQDQDALPFMVWSAGQREFTPLLLGLYWLTPSTQSSRRGDIRWVVIEEPEMGLHPRAIEVVMLLILELLSRDYRVCLSTHCPLVLEMVWAIRHVQKYPKRAYQSLFRLFGLSKQSPALRAIFERVISKKYRVYYFAKTFDRESQIDENVTVRDISELNPFAAEKEVATWGELLAFSECANQVVSQLPSDGSEKDYTDSGQVDPSAEEGRVSLENRSASE